MDLKKKIRLYVAFKRIILDVGTNRLKVNGWKKIFYASGKKPTGVAIFISDKINFKTKNVIKDKEGCYIILKGSIQQEDITFVNIYAPNIKAPK